MKTKIAIAKLAVGFALLPASVAATAQQVAPTTSDSVSTVYFIKDINSENLLKIYNALDRRATGKICVKLSFGEEGNPNHLAPELIAPLVKGLNATLVECNTAYKSSRRQSSDHLKTAKEHGFTAIAPIDIMDEAGETALPVKNGKHIDYALIGKNWLDYDYTIVLSHFKGHPMGGFGGALKNMAIGMPMTGGTTAPPRMISLRQWLNRQKPSWTMPATGSCTFRWQTICRSTVTVWHIRSRYAWPTSAYSHLWTRWPSTGLVWMPSATPQTTAKYIWKNASPTATARIFSTMPRALASAHKNMF